MKKKKNNAAKSKGGPAVAAPVPTALHEIDTIELIPKSNTWHSLPADGDLDVEPTTLQGLNIGDADVRREFAAPSSSHMICADCKFAEYPAIAAAGYGHFTCLELLHRQGLVLACQDHFGTMPLHAAAKFGHVQCAKFLIDRAGSDFAARDNSGLTAAHHAAFQGHLPLLKILHSYSLGECVNDSSATGATPLHVAAAAGQLACIRWLCSAEVGVSPNELDANELSPLYFAAQEGHLDCVDWLVRRGGCSPVARGTDGMCAVHAAAQAGKLICLGFMLKHSPAKAAQIRDHDGATPMHVAAARGHIECLRLLLEQPGSTGDEVDNFGATAAHDAAEEGQLASLKTLSHYGANLFIKDKEGFTPYARALESSCEECAMWLSSRREKLADDEVLSPRSMAKANEAEEADLLDNLADLRSHATRMGDIAQRLLSLDRRASLSPSQVTGLAAAAMRPGAVSPTTRPAPSQVAPAPRLSGAGLRVQGHGRP